MSNSHSYSQVIAKLKRQVSEVKTNEKLAPYTTFKIGGCAPVVVEVTTERELVYVVDTCIQEAVPFKVLGCGSNLLISDSGYEGVVIINKARDWSIIAENPDVDIAGITDSRHHKTTKETTEYTEKNAPQVLVRIASGARLIPLMKQLFDNGITGLQWYAGIPSTVGGAVYMNLHGGSYCIGDRLVQARLIVGNGIKTVNNDYFRFDYDYSILHKTHETLVSCDLLLQRGDVSKAREFAKAWVQKKKGQPQCSAGCIFKNLTKEQQEKLGLPTPSTGYFIDHILKLKGERSGGAMISTTHAAFIENTGGATAEDVCTLIALVKNKAREVHQLELEQEVEMLGNFI